MKIFSAAVVLAALTACCSEAWSQCPNAGGGGGTGGQGGGGQNFARGGGPAPVLQSGLQNGSGRQFGGQGGRLLTGPGSHFYDVMVQNQLRQQALRHQAMLAAARQAQRAARDRAQNATRRRQREAEVARREALRQRAFAPDQRVAATNRTTPPVDARSRPGL